MKLMARVVFSVTSIPIQRALPPTFAEQGEISLMSPEPKAVEAQAYFDRAIEVARQQEANPGNCAPQ